MQTMMMRKKSAPKHSARALILTALPLEFEAVRKHLQRLEQHEHPRGTQYELGYFESDGFEWAVLLGEVGAGNRRAAAEAERAISFFSPQAAFFVVAAGG